MTRFFFLSNLKQDLLFKKTVGEVAIERLLGDLITH